MAVRADNVALAVTIGDDRSFTFQLRDPAGDAITNTGTGYALSVTRDGAELLALTATGSAGSAVFTFSDVSMAEGPAAWSLRDTTADGTLISGPFQVNPVGTAPVGDNVVTVSVGEVIRIVGSSTAGPQGPPGADGSGTINTTKGDLYGYSTAAARIPVGTNTHVLTADSSQALGVKWAAPDVTQAELDAAASTAAAALAAHEADTTSIHGIADTSALETTTGSASKVSTHAALTSVHGISAFGATLVDDADQAAARTTLGVVIGTDVQAQDAELAAIAGLTSAADRLPYFTGSGTAALATFTAAGRALVDDADNTAQRTTLGLGAAAVLGATAILRFVVDGGGSAITTGAKKAYCTVPWACTITSWNILADQSGSIVFDVWKDTYANYPPTVADTITASAKPTLTTATKATSSTLTGWTTSVTAGDVLEVNVDSITTCTKVVLELLVTRTA